MTLATAEQLHADHRLWEEEVAMWRDDIALWQEEQQERMAELEQAIGAHAAALEQHAEEIVQHEEDTVQHEHFLAELLKCGGPNGGDAEEAWQETHAAERARHAGQREAHERIKRHHHTAMAKIGVVIAALKSPE